MLRGPAWKQSDAVVSGPGSVMVRYLVAVPCDNSIMVASAEVWYSRVSGSIEFTYTVLCASGVPCLALNTVARQERAPGGDVLAENAFSLEHFTFASCIPTYSIYIQPATASVASTHDTISSSSSKP